MLKTKKRYTVGNPGGQWVVWDHKPQLRWIATCPRKADAQKIARILNKSIS